MKLKGLNNFIRNTAEVQGGAMYWDTIEPIFSDENVKFDNNKA